MRVRDTSGQSLFRFSFQRVKAAKHTLIPGPSLMRHQMVCCSRRDCAERENSKFGSTDSLSRMIPKSGNRVSEKIMRKYQVREVPWPSTFPAPEKKMPPAS
jgi:hypothetical protein